MTEPRLLEADLQRAVIDLLRTFGYRVAHFRPAQTVHGWRTPVSADGKGFVDLIAISEEQKRFLAVELKREGGKCTPEQTEWLRIFKAAGVETYVWRTTDRFEDIAEIVRQRPVLEAQPCP